MGLIFSKETSSCGQVWILLQMFRVLTGGESLVPVTICQMIVISGQWIWSEWAAEAGGGEKPGDCQGLDVEAWRKIYSRTFLNKIWLIDEDSDVIGSCLCYLSLLYLPGVGLENWIFYSCPGKRTGSYAWAAQNLAQHVPGLYPASWFWLLDFFH